MSERLPTFLGVGAAKSGTTILYQFLASHPEVYMSRIKETNFFSSDIDPQRFRKDYMMRERAKNINLDEYVNGNQEKEYINVYVKDIEHYKKLFKFAGNAKAIGEISNSYLFSKKAAENIKLLIPDVKIFMILRNPIDRAYSHYFMNVRDGWVVNKPFIDEITEDMMYPERELGKAHCYIEMGMYYEQVLRFKKLFEPSQLQIFLYDDLLKNPEHLIKDLFEFIEVDPNIPIDKNRKINTAKLPKYPRLMGFITRLGLKRKSFNYFPVSIQSQVKEAFFSKKTAPKMTFEERKFIQKFYHKDIKKLSELIEKDLSDWQFPG